jgi:tetratricopeptide (TPR) repeat protein
MMSAVYASPAAAKDMTLELDMKHKACLERIAVDSELAYEEAMIWRDEGGSRRAKHCEAMALFALGHEGEAARRLDLLAEASDGGSPEMRADFYAEAANFWLAEGEAVKAYESASAGLKLKYDHEDLRISRARAYAGTGHYEYAEMDLTSVLALAPMRADALRYRADARMKQDKLEEAKADIEASLRADPTQVDTALLRGKINEAMRLQNNVPATEPLPIKE